MKSYRIQLQKNSATFDKLNAVEEEQLILLYYYMRNFCNLIGLEQWYFSLI